MLKESMRREKCLAEEMVKEAGHGCPDPRMLLSLQEEQRRPREDSVRRVSHFAKGSQLLDLTFAAILEEAQRP